MPRYKVTAPDGRTFYVNAPEGATKEQALVYARKHMPAAKPKSSGPLGWISDNVLSPLNEAIIGVPEGIYNAASAVTDPIAKRTLSLFQGEEAAESALQQARGQRRAVSDAATDRFVSQRAPLARDIGRIGGSLAIPLPGKKLQEGGRLARTGYRAMQGAVGGAAVREVDQSATAPAAIGAAANVALPPILSRLAQTGPAQAVGRVISRYGAPLVNAADDMAENVISRFTGRPAMPRVPPAPVAPSARALEPLGREAEARAARFASVGVDKPTTGMVTRDPGAFTFEQNIAKVDDVGADLRQQLLDVESSLAAKGRELVNRAGGAKGAEATGRANQEVFDAKRNEMKEVTGRWYTKMREERGDEPVGDIKGFREFIDSPQVTDNAAFDAMRESISRRLKRFGDGPTIGQTEELRKFIGGLGSGIEPSVRMMRGKMIDALDDDVVTAVGDDPFKVARESAKAGFAEWKKTFAGKIADEKIAPEALTKKILSDTTSLSDLRAVRASHLTGTEKQVERGLEAWKGLRAQSLDNFLTGATDANGNLMGAKLAKDFTKLAPKFRELLDPADYKMLRRLVNATRDAKVAPAQSSVNYSGSATTLANMFPSMRPATRQGWMKLLAKNGMSHVAAYTVAGPTGNLALWGGKAALSAAAESKAAATLIKRAQLASNPEEAAAAIKAMREAAKTEPAVKKLLDQLGPAIGGNAAAQ